MNRRGIVITEENKDLQKGSLQRRNPFNPLSKENETTQTKQRMWTHEEMSEMRDSLPKMEGAARLRALNKLAAKTHVRKDPKTGERLFLMHRGMGREEYKGAHDHKNGYTKYEIGERTSWTPKYDVPYDFATAGGGVVSAWIPESSIIHSLNQFNSPTQEGIENRNKPFGPKKPNGRKEAGGRSITERDEDEFIVQHDRPFLHADKDFIDKLKDQKSLERFGPADWGLPKTPSVRARINKPSRTAELQGQDKRELFNQGINLKEKIKPVEQNINKSEKIMSKKFVLHEASYEKLKKNVPTMKQMLGPNLTQEHQEHINWAKKLPNSNWQIWATRHYKNKPEDFTPEIKQKIEHYAGSQHIPEISKVQFEKHHDLHSGLQMLENAEKQYNDKIKNNINVVEPSKKTFKFVQGVEKPNRHWFGLGVGSCKNEGKAMGHCGNVPSEVEGDEVLSFRTEHKIGKRTYHEPHLTFINNNGFLGEMKGRGNEKPAPHYHREIANLLKHPRIKGVMGGGYEAKNNFHFTDLSPELQQEVLKANPDLITMDGSEEDLHKILYGNVDFPEKHQDVLKEIASNPKLDPKHHGRLANDESESVRQAIASNPNLDPKHHGRLANDESWRVREAMASNPNLDPKLHERLAGDKDRYVREAIASNPNLNLKFHERLVNDGDSIVREAIASNPKLDPKHHERLANDESWHVRKAIALNPNLDPKHHERLANDEDSDVRQAIASNPNLDPKLHERLANDEDSDVRKAMASNPNLDPKLHERLAGDEDRYVRQAIAFNPNLDPKHHGRLVNNADWTVRKAIALNSNLDPKFHERLANDEDSIVREAIAFNPNLDPKHHERLANDENPSVRIAIARNSNLDPKHHERLVRDGYWDVRKAIASNPNLDPKLYNILLKDSDPSVRAAIKKNPSYIKWKEEQEKSKNNINKSEKIISKKIVLHEASCEKLTKNVPTMKQMLGPNLTQEHQEHIDWAKKLPNSNWQLWATRHYKNKPEDFTPEIKQKIEHYAGSQHIPEISNVQFDKSHDLHSGLQMLENAEKQYNDKIKNNINVVEPSKKTFKFVQGVEKPNRHWFGLGKGSCKNEGKAMGHCGNVPSEVEGDEVLSFRTEHKIGKRTYHEPHLTFIYNNGFLGEMKGRGNEKPAKHYHREIANLLKHPRIKGIMGGGYEAKNNFHFTDLSPELQKEVLNANPNLITMDGSDEDLHRILYGNVDFPEKHRDILKEIAYNPNLDPKHHERLVNDENWAVRSAIASNPNLDPKHHGRLANDESWRVREAMASNPNLDPKLHERLAGDENLYVREAIASNPKLDPKHHGRLVGDKSEDVRTAIAINPNLDPKLHERLVGDENEYVRKAIASNPNLDPKHHERLAGDKNLYVRTAIASNPNLDPKFHERLVGDKEDSVRTAIASNPNLDPKFHERLANDEDSIVREAIASNPNLDSKHHERLVNDENLFVRKTIASNPNLDPKLHERLVNDNSSVVRDTIASNPNLDSKHQERLVGDKDKYVRKAIASNPNLDPKLHERLVNDGDSFVRRAIALNPNLNSKLHEKLVGDEDWAVRKAIARNPNLDPRLYNILLKDSNSDVRAAIKKNPSYIKWKEEQEKSKNNINKSEKILVKNTYNYKIHRDEDRPEKIYGITAYHNGKEIGFATIDHKAQHIDDPSEISIDRVYVKPKHRRKGVATSMYKLLEEHSGKKIIPSENQSPLAIKLWNNPNRPFGKSEGFAKSSKRKKQILTKSEKSDLNKSDNFIRRGILLAALAGTVQHVHDKLQGQKEEASRPYASQEVAIEKPKTESEKAFDEAQKQAFGIAAKGWPLSRKLAKETIKAYPDLHQQHGYLLHLSPSAFKEVINNNPEIKKDIALRHYDKLHEMFNGDKDKIFDAYKAKSMKTKEL
jgi:GNAT superfamily N-acetyltransferase